MFLKAEHIVNHRCHASHDVACAIGTICEGKAWCKWVKHVEYQAVCSMKIVCVTGSRANQGLWAVNTVSNRNRRCFFIASVFILTGMIVSRMLPTFLDVRHLAERKSNPHGSYTDSTRVVRRYCFCAPVSSILVLVGLPSSGPHKWI
jgi:hypothetical protein